MDIAVEALGRPETFMQCTKSVKDGGKAVMIGLAQAGSVGEIDINRLVRRKVSLFFFCLYSRTEVALMHIFIFCFLFLQFKTGMWCY